MAAKLEPSGAGRKRKRAAAGLADLHDDMLERVLARLPPATFSRLRAVSRRWRAAAASATFRAACATVPARDPWFLMLSDRHTNKPLPVFDSGARAWARWRGAPAGRVPVASAGGLVLYRDAATGGLTVANPLTGATRALPPPPPAAGVLQAVAMYGSSSISPRCYRVLLFLGGDLSDGVLSMLSFDSSADKWDDAQVPLTRQPKDETARSSPEAAAAEEEYDDAVYFLSKSGDVVAPTMRRTAARQYASAVTRRPEDDGVLVHFLSPSGTVVACDVARRAFAELPRILPAFHEYSVDVVACAGGAAYVVVLSELLGAASLRVWELAGPGGGGWRQVAAMPPAMSQPFFGAKADVNCVGHGDRIMVCVAGEGGAGGCFMCDVKTNRWEELPPCVGQEGEATDFVAAVSFEPRMEADV